MKLLAISDLHGDWTTGGLERFDEVSRALDQVSGHAAARKVDRVLFLGDLTDPDVDPTLAHRTIARFLEFAFDLRSVNIELDCLVGNHDVIEDGRGSHTLMALAKAGFRVHATPGNTFVTQNNERTEFVYLPYAGTARRYDPDRYVRDLAGSHRLGTKGGTLVVLGHMTRVSGAVEGSETTDMPRGRDMTFPMEALAELVASTGYEKTVFLNGHYHRAVTDGPVLIPGSLARLTHGEEHHEPGFLVVEF